MAESHSNIWKPIEDLPEDWSSSLRNEQTLAMVQVWHDQAGELQDKDLYKEFLNKLRREWSIETGVGQAPVPDFWVGEYVAYLHAERSSRNP